MFFVKIVSVLLSSAHCLHKSLECVFSQNILHLVLIMLVLPVTAAVCERAFSAQMMIKSDSRASLHSDTVADLIRISVEGPSLEDFDARESVASWFSEGQRSRRSNYRSGPSEEHVTAMESITHRDKRCSV